MTEDVLAQTFPHLNQATGPVTIFDLAVIIERADDFMWQQHMMPNKAFSATVCILVYLGKRLVLHLIQAYQLVDQAMQLSQEAAFSCILIAVAALM